MCTSNFYIVWGIRPQLLYSLGYSTAHEEYRKRNAKRKSDTRSRQGRKQSRQGRKLSRQGRKQSRQGRKQIRQGRKQSRQSRKQNGDRRHRKTFRVLNVQRPWARLLLTGVKKVDVRKYPLKNYMDENLWLLETKGEGAPRDFASRIIGSIRYDGCLLT